MHIFVNCQIWAEISSSLIWIGTPLKCHQLSQQCQCIVGTVTNTDSSQASMIRQLIAVVIVRETDSMVSTTQIMTSEIICITLLSCHSNQATVPRLMH